MNEKQKELAGALIGLARSLDDTNKSPEMLRVMVDGLIALRDENVQPDAVKRVHAAKEQAAPDCSRCQHPCGRTADCDLDTVLPDPTREQLLQRAAEYAASVAPGSFQPALDILTEALFAVGYEWFDAEEIEGILDKLDRLGRESDAQKAP